MRWKWQNKRRCETATAGSDTKSVASGLAEQSKSVTVSESNRSGGFQAATGRSGLPSKLRSGMILTNIDFLLHRQESWTRSFPSLASFLLPPLCFFGHWLIASAGCLLKEG